MSPSPRVRPKTLFLFDPAGIELLRNKKPVVTNTAPGLFTEAQRVLIGASRRPFSSVLGGDQIEFKKVMRFFG